jgi:Porin subfamily
MKMVKSLILGSTAGLLAMSGAQAADLPVKAKAVEYVRICSLYGAGFFYIPGTDTCIKIGGYLRVDTTFNGSTYGQPAWSGDLGLGDRYRNSFQDRSRFALTVDTRTATEYGVVRTFAQADFQQDTAGQSASSNPNNLASNLAANTTGFLQGPGTGYTAVEYLFLQFAGFTFGKSSSAYSTPWNGFPGNISSYLIGGNDTVTGVSNIQYTAQFGNGVSASIGLDDPSAYNRVSVANLAIPTSAVGAQSNAYAGVNMPDIVGNIRVDQAWGLFQISGAVHEVDASYNSLNGVPGTGVAVATPANTVAATSLSALSGHPETKYGGSVMAALNIKNIPTGPGDDIKIDASWARGDTKNVLGTANAIPGNFVMLGGTAGQFGASNTIAFATNTDGVYTPAGGLELTTAYGVRGAFNHNWDPYWSSSLFGGMAWVNYDGAAQAAYCASYAATVAHTATNVYTCNPNYTLSMLGASTRWTPVKNLTFTLEGIWTHLSTGFSGTATIAPGAPYAPTALTFKGQDTATLQARVQRNF